MSAYMRTYVRSAAAVIAYVVTAGTSDVSASPYRLEILAQVGDVIDNRTIVHFSNENTNVSINNEGEVAFFAAVDGPDGIGYSVLTQRRFIAGAGKVVDGTVPGFNSEDHQVDMNNAGQAVYTAFLPQGGRGLFINENLLFRPGDAIDGRVLTHIGRYSGINDSGTVVFEGRHSDIPAMFTQAMLLAEYGQTLDGFTLAGMGFPRIGNNGDIAFYSLLVETDRDAIVTPNRILIKVGDVVEEQQVGSIHSIGGFNDVGELPITMSMGQWPDWEHYVVTENRILFRADDLIDGRRVVGLSGTNTVLNNRDNLALLGAVEGADSTIYNALFAGGRIVASEGDSIGGIVITKIFPNFDMNDRGDIAFRVEFDNGARAVLLAVVPEPSTLVLILISVAAASIVWRSRRRQICRRC
jgi:hypothetical protein